MRRILFVISMLCIFASFVPLTVQAATGYSTDFEGFTAGTLAGDLTVPGITFVANSGNWKIYTVYTFAPNVVGAALATFGGDLTMNFATLQGSVQF